MCALSVYAGTLGATTPVALKETFGGAGGGAERESAMNEVIQECKVLHRLRHPNITQLYGLWRGYDPDLAEMRVFMVLEFCGGGTLAETVDSRDSEVTGCCIVRWARLCCVLVYMHVCLGGGTFCLHEAVVWLPQWLQFAGQ